MIHTLLSVTMQLLKNRHSKMFNRFKTSITHWCVTIRTDRVKFVVAFFIPNYLFLPPPYFYNSLFFIPATKPSHQHNTKSSSEYLVVHTQLIQTCINPLTTENYSTWIRDTVSSEETFLRISEKSWRNVLRYYMYNDVCSELMTRVSAFWHVVQF